MTQFLNLARVILNSKNKSFFKLIFNTFPTMIILILPYKLVHYIRVHGAMQTVTKLYCVEHNIIVYYTIIFLRIPIVNFFK